MPALTQHPFFRDAVSDPASRHRRPVAGPHHASRYRSLEGEVAAALPNTRCASGSRKSDGTDCKRAAGGVDKFSGEKMRKSCRSLFLLQIFFAHPDGGADSIHTLIALRRMGFPKAPLTCVFPPGPRKAGAIAYMGFDPHSDRLRRPPLPRSPGRGNADRKARHPSSTPRSGGEVAREAGRSGENGICDSPAPQGGGLNRRPKRVS